MEFAELKKEEHNSNPMPLQKKSINHHLKTSQNMPSGDVRFCQNRREEAENQTVTVVQKMRWLWNGEKWLPMYPTEEEPPEIKGFERGAICNTGDYDPKLAIPFSPKFEPDKFALFKLLGKAKDNDLYRTLLENALMAKIYVNYTEPIDEIPPGTTLLTVESDFPGEVYVKDKTLYIIKIHGMGRAKEAESYLQRLTLAEIEIIHGDNKDEEIIESRLGGKTMYRLNYLSSVHLIIMPLSTLGQLDKRKYNIDWIQTEYPHEWIVCLETNETYFVADIKWANGSLVTALINVLNQHCEISSVDLYGTAGSLNPEIGPGTLVTPQGPFHSIDTEYRGNPQDTENVAVGVNGFCRTNGHGNVSSILDEDDLGVRDLVDMGVDTVDMEGYHLVRKLNEMKEEGKEIPLRMIFRIHDVVTSEDENITKPREQNEITWRKKIETDGQILKAFGLSCWQ